MVTFAMPGSFTVPAYIASKSYLLCDMFRQILVG
jgi:hypothetical protein